MVKSKRFEPLQEMAANSAQALSRAVADAGRKVSELEAQLQQLEHYRDEYVRTSTQGAGGMDAVKLQNFRSFLGRLGEALRQHKVKLEHARVEFERRRAAWSEKRVEAESLSRAINRFRREERHTADRNEQREGDDGASRTLLAGRNGTP